VLRFVVGVLAIALFVMIVEFGRVRGRVGELETAGAPAPAAATQDPLGSPQTFKVVLKEMAVVPDVVEVPAGTPVTLDVVNQGEIPHNLAISGGPKTPDLKSTHRCPRRAAWCHPRCSDQMHRPADAVLSL
jgi:hypothetical protein